MGHPVISTWCKVIYAGYFRGWPELTYNKVRRHVSIKTETDMGHMDQQRQGTRPTKELTVTGVDDSMKSVPKNSTNNKTHHIYMTITDIAEKIYSDQTGRFPVTYNREKFYVVIFMHLTATKSSHILSSDATTDKYSKHMKSYTHTYELADIVPSSTRWKMKRQGT